MLNNYYELIIPVSTFNTKRSPKRESFDKLTWNVGYLDYAFGDATLGGGYRQENKCNIWTLESVLYIYDIFSLDSAIIVHDPIIVVDIYKL